MTTRALIPAPLSVWAPRVAARVKRQQEAARRKAAMRDLAASVLRARAAERARGADRL
jgi:hypothetical protein